MRPDAGLGCIKSALTDRAVLKALIVESEPILANRLEWLRAETANWLVSRAICVDQAMEALKSQSFDLLIIDLDVPNCAAEKILREARSVDRDSSVLLTNVSDWDRANALLDAGADQWVKKACEAEELIARCRALTRRRSSIELLVNRFGDLSIDIAKQEVAWKGQTVDLSPTELRILHILALQAQRVVSKRSLSESVCEMAVNRGDNVIEVHVSNLRKKLRQHGAAEIIQTLRGRGYRFRALGW